VESLNHGILMFPTHDAIDPATLAKEVASLDHLSGGRFLFGVGAGWNREEMADHGTDPRTRMRRMAENVIAMKELWTKDEAQFHGEYVDFGSSWAWPKPAQSPHPPVLVGGMGPTVEDRVLDFGDEWPPQGVTTDTMASFAERARALQQRASDEGRGRIPMSMFGAQATPEARDGYADTGVDRAVYPVSSSDRDTVLKELDALVGLIG